ncbi:MAG: Crp/Fnr family transcriptional regulator [Sphingobacteriales bacterium]|jgi:CRP-like cAMP-binding protein|nr:MAG: Crp/Fnr family transcriptional regulator [Sphingobacteriales bacterium]
MKKAKKSCDLKSCSFCKLCLKEWLPAVDTNRETYTVDKGDVLCKEGERVTGIYFVFEGAVKVHKKWGEKELIVRFAKKGDIVGHRGLGYDIFYPVSATAIEPSVVCFIPIDFFLASLKVNQEYLYQLMLFFAEELKVSERKMRNLAHMPVKGRVALALLTLQEQFGNKENGHIDLTLSRQDLASYTGATYETVFRVLNDLTQEQLIAVTGKQFKILSVEKLTLVSSLPE